MDFYTPVTKEEEKAGYNQAGKISEILSMLRLTFTSAMIDTPNNFDYALEACRGVANIISGKVNEDILDEINTEVYAIEKLLPAANEKYTNQSNGSKYFSNPEKRVELKKRIENLWRGLEQVQDEYGYGMFSEDDSGL